MPADDAFPVNWSEVKDLFHRALEKPATDRHAFVAAETVSNPTLRQQVERLLAAHDEAGSFIDPPADPTVTPQHEARRSPLTGRVIGRYQVGRLIGAGGMGEVYAARDVDLGRDVALKIGVDTDSASHARLRQEAQHASQLNHPHICTIHEVGVFDGQPYIIMELVEGERLSDLIPASGLDRERTIRYAVQIADALAHAHRHGVSHRDLKSDNVVITSDGRAKVLDFGLAQRLEPHRLKELSQSRAAWTDTAPVVAGTLSSMAPEVLRGEKSDERSDIWAFGILLYEMVAGSKPFTGATGFELTAAILHQAPRVLPATVPASLRAIIGRCLARNPGERYQTAGEVRSALETLQSAHVEPRPFRISLRTRPALTAIAALALILVGMAVWLLNPRDETSLATGASGRPAIAVMQFENVTGAGDVEWMSRGVPNMLLSGLAQTRGLDVVSAQRVHEVMKQISEAPGAPVDRRQVAEAARRVGAGAVVVGSIVKAGSDIRIDAQLEDVASGRVLVAQTVRGTDVFALVDQLATAIRSGIGFRDAGPLRHVAEISTSSLEAYRYYSEGLAAYNNTRIADARGLFEKAVAMDPAFAQAYLHLMLVARHQRLEKEAETFERRAVEHSDRLDERQRLLLKAEVARHDSPVEAIQALEELIAKYPDTEQAYALACTLYQPVVGPLQNRAKQLAVVEAGVAALPSSTLLRNYYGYALLGSGRFSEAVRVFESYAELAPREPNPFDSLGEAHVLMGYPDKAIEYYSRALTIQPSFFPSHVGRDFALSMLGRYDEALASGPSYRHVDAFMLARLGRYREAAQLVGDDIRDATAIGNIGDVAIFHLLLAVLELEQKQPSGVKPHIWRPEDLPVPVPPEPTRIYLVIAHTLAGLAAIQQNRIDEARSRLTEQSRIFRADSAAELWWHKLLEGEVALAEGKLDTAAKAFAGGEPRGKMWLHFHTYHVPLLANNLLWRDGLARVAKARGDFASAIAAYQRLLAPGLDQKWNAMYEPRFVLEIARLHEQLQDNREALKYYERFLQFWKNADGDLPELAAARSAVRRLRKS